MTLWKWFRRGRADRQTPSAQGELKGAPVHARVKTFSAESGFVYQYVYRGYRRRSDPAGSEHVFDANRDRTRHFRVTIYLTDDELQRCGLAIGRDLIAAERYALVKMTLFRLLDEEVDVTELERPVTPVAREMEEHLRTLGRV